MIAFVAAAFALAPVAVAHIYSYQGADYSYDFSNTTGVTVCDQETDGNGAYANYARASVGTYNDVADANGSEPGCSASTYGQGIAPITSFQTCEDQFGSDPCDVTRYH